MKILNKQINFFDLIRYSYLLIFISVFAMTITNYKSNVILYIIYSLVVLYCLLLSSKRQTKIFIFFLFFFLFFGLWFKLSINSFTNFKYLANTGNFFKSNYVFDINDLDVVVQISMFSFLFFYLPLIIPNAKKKIFQFKNQEKNILSFYFKNEKYLLIFISIILITIPIINIIFSFYQKGQVPEKKNIYFFFNFWINYFAPCLISYLIYLSFRNNNYKFFFIILIEPTLSAISAFSRWVMLIYYVYFIGFIKSQIIFKKKYIYLFLIGSIIFTIISNLNVYQSRENRFKKAAEEYSTLLENKKVHEIKINNYFKDILFNRFLGVDGIMAVITSNNQSFKNLSMSFKSEDIFKNSSFYEKKYLFISSNDNEAFLKKNITSQNSPGIIAYLLFSGSHVFLYTVIFILSFVLLKLENVLNILFKNKIFISVIMFHLVYKIFHFGFSPSNSYKFLIGISICIISPILVNKLLGSFSWKKLK